MRLAPERAMVALSLLLAGCAGGEEAPSLLNAVDFAPRQAEVGDRLEIIGSGFPEGKAAVVSFRGELHRPGQEGPHAVEITAPAASASQNRVGLVLTEELQSRFCGTGEVADHTTFRGDVMIAFPARAAGAPPVTGIVHNVVLDVNGPAVPTEIARRREIEAARARAFIGIEIDASARGSVSVTKVLPGSRAERAGVLANDQIVSIDGVNVLAPSDVVFTGSSRSSRFLLRRGRLKEPIERVLDVQGFRPAAPRELAVVGVLVGVVVMLFALWMAPIARVLGWIERRVAARLRTRAPRDARAHHAVRLLGRVQASLAEDIAPSSEPLLLRLFPYVSFLGTSAAATTIAFERPLVSKDLDLGLIVSSSTTVLVAVALATGGWRGKGRWSIGAGLQSALSTLALQLPVLAALGAVLFASGSLRIADLVSQQGAAPWSWNAFRNPVLFLAFVLVLIASFPSAQRAGTELPDADLEAASPRSGLMFYVEWAHLLVVSTLSAMLFLGGWALPSGTLPRGTGLYGQAAGALLLQIKCWAVAGVVVALRWALPRVRSQQMTGVFWRWLLPVSLLLLPASVLWAAWIERPALRSIEPVVGYALFGLSLGAALKFLGSVQRHVRAPSAPMHVNPWL